jgi:hypothetical protein
MEYKPVWGPGQRRRSRHAGPRRHPCRRIQRNGYGPTPRTCGRHPVRFYPIVRDRPSAETEADEVVESASDIRKIAFLGDYLPRKCGIATFTSDLLSAVAAEHPESQCSAVPVNDLPGGYEHLGVVRFEIEEQDLLAYSLSAASNGRNVTAYFMVGSVSAFDLSTPDSSAPTVTKDYPCAPRARSGVSANHLARPTSRWASGRSAGDPHGPGRSAHAGCRDS